MRKRAKKYIAITFTFARDIFRHPLFSGSAVMIVGSNFSNFLAYLYHLVIGRLLGPSNYGELVAFISIVSILTMIVSFFGLVVAKFVSMSNTHDEAKAFISWIKYKAFVVGAVVGLIILILTPLLSDFLKVKASILIFVAPLFLMYSMAFIYRSILQGLLRFGRLVIAANVDNFGKFVLGIAFVYAGFSVFGAVLGTVLAAFISLLFYRYYVRDYENGSQARLKYSNRVWKYTVPVFVVSVASYSMFTTDLILAKHFLSATEAGLYAALSNLGKIVFYGVAPVSSVMFPLVSKRFAKGEKYAKILLASVGLTLVISLLVVVLYWQFPNKAVGILYGEEFLPAARDLVWFGLFMAMFSLASLFANFYLSKEETKISAFVALAALLQIAGIWIYHGSIIEIVGVSLACVSGLLICLVLYGLLRKNAVFIR